MINSMEKEISNAEEMLRLAMETSNVDEIDNLLSPDLLFTTHLGQVITKSDDLDGHRKKDLRIESLNLSDQRIKFVGEVAIVATCAQINGSFKGLPANGNFRFTRVWTKNNGHWQVVAGHSSILA